MSVFVSKVETVCMKITISECVNSMLLVVFLMASHAFQYIHVVVFLF